MIMYKRTPRTNAKTVMDYMKQKAIQESTFDLYPKEETKEKTFAENNAEIFYENKKRRNKLIESKSAFMDEVQKALVSNALFYSIMEPVLDEQVANTHEKTLAASVINEFVNQQNIPQMIRDWKHKSIYLAEIASNIDKYTDIIKESADEKIKQGLSEKDAFDIEDADINKFVIDIKDTIPKDITKLISDRVEDSVDNFIDTNKKNKFEIKKIYDNTKGKIDQINQDQAEVTQDVPTDQPDQTQVMQQEAVAFARRKEREILERPTTVFGEMTNIMLESIHKVGVLKEAYSNEYNKINFGKIVNDTKVMYSFLECINTLNLVPIDEEYINNMLFDMRKSVK